MSVAGLAAPSMTASQLPAGLNPFLAEDPRLTHLKALMQSNMGGLLAAQGRYGEAQVGFKFKNARDCCLCVGAVSTAARRPTALHAASLLGPT